jgi:RNA polymerase sigma-70 factor (ECF subfamily)
MQTDVTREVVAAAVPPVLDEEPGSRSCTPDDARFDAVYEEHFEFVFRAIRRLGVDPSAIDDAVQDAFVVVHRRLGDFEGRSSMKTWLFGIALRVARDYRRVKKHRRDWDPLHDELVDAAPSPLESAARAEGARVLEAVLDTLDDEKREVFVLAELEQLGVPEIAELVGINLNTAYSRLRAARRDFEEAAERYRRRQR